MPQMSEYHFFLHNCTKSTYIRNKFKHVYGPMFMCKSTETQNVSFPSLRDFFRRLNIGLDLPGRQVSQFLTMHYFSLWGDIHNNVTSLSRRCETQWMEGDTLRLVFFSKSTSKKKRSKKRSEYNSLLKFDNDEILQCLRQYS